jgi:hypothetical protein
MQATHTSCSWQRRLAASRMILLLTALVVAMMPVTEQLCTWDPFILTGHDFEFSLLGVLVFCALVALFAHQLAIVSPLFLLMIAQHLKAPPLRGLIDGAPGLIARMAVDCTTKDRSPDLCVSLPWVSLRI